MFKMCPLTFSFQIVPTPQRRPRLLHRHCFPPGMHFKIVAGVVWSKHERADRCWNRCLMILCVHCFESTVCIINTLNTFQRPRLWNMHSCEKLIWRSDSEWIFDITIQTNFYIFSHWRSATKAAGRQADNISNFQHSGRCSTAASLSVRWVIPTPCSNTNHILTHKRGKWTPSRGVFPVHCKGNFAVCDNARFFCELCSPWRCWTSVCTGCCPVLCYRNRRWEVPRLGSSPQPRGPVPQSRLSVSSPLTKGDKLRRWRFFSPSLQFDRSKRVCKVVVGRHCRTGVCSVVRWSRTKSQLKR